MKTPAQNIVLAPVITEASMAGIQMKKYTFKVAKEATKVDIARAVEELFGVKVAKVNTIHVRGRYLALVIIGVRGLPYFVHRHTIKQRYSRKGCRAGEGCG